MPLLELDSIAVSYGRIQALRGVSLSVDAGEIVALLGANGAGKSTTLKTISGLLRAQSGGRVVFDGQSIANLSPEQIVRAGVVHVPEGRRIFPGLSVADNLAMGAANRGRLSRRALRGEIEEMLDVFPALRPLTKAAGWTLSGGQQQMLALGRGLMGRPRLLLLDEPSLGLAPVIVDQVFDVITQIRTRGTTVLLVEQNATIALSVSDRAYVLETGQTVLEGKSADLLGNEAVRRAYLGMAGEVELPRSSGEPAG